MNACSEIKKISSIYIKLFVMDVDGTLTDGKIYMGADGEVFKAFNVHDGYGIHNILHSQGIMTAIITGRSSEIVTRRAKELKIDHVLQDVTDKASALRSLQEKLHVTKEETVYIGDDIPDLPAMELSGVNGCPCDAVPAVREKCAFVSSLPGGSGAVREFIDWLVLPARIPPAVC